MSALDIQQILAEVRPSATSTPDELAGVASVLLPSRAVLIEIADPLQLAKDQGGAAGSAAVAFARAIPSGSDALASTVFDKIRDEIVAAMKQKGVSARVSVVSPAGYAPAGVSPIWKGLAVTLGVGGLGLLALKIVRRFRKKG